MLEIRNLSVDYAGVIALQDVSLTARPGKITALVGANGAGKTTLLKAVSGLLRPGAGEIVFNGHPLVGQTPNAIVAAGLCHVPEGRGLFPYMSLLDNLLLGAYRRKDKVGINHDLEKVFSYFPGLKDHRHRLARDFSGGQQQMIAIGRGIMARPAFYLFDEPSIGLAPLVTREVLNTIGHIAEEEDKGVLLVEQNANLALDLASEAYVIELGHIVMSGSAQAIKADENVRKAYLGL